MPNYLRYRIKGGCYFFTVNLLERKNTLLIDHIDLLRESVRVCKQKRPFHLAGNEFRSLLPPRRQGAKKKLS